MEKLFIYGTLAPGEANHDVLADIDGVWEPATLTGKLLKEGWGVEFGCPGIVPSENGEEVAGYLFSSNELAAHWAMLDEFEGSGYKRTLVTVKIEGGEKIQAYVYALNLAD